MSELEVSVVIPTFNRKDMLREMLEALCDQTLSPSKFEVIVVVDGSTDGTWEMLQELRVPYAVRPVFQDNAGLDSKLFSSGVSVARNRGAGMAEGQVLLFLDDDLLPRPELLEEHIDIHRDDSAAVVLGRLLPTSDDAKGKQGWNIWEERVLANHYRLMAIGTREAAGWRLYSANFSVRRDLFLKVNGFDLRMGHVRGEDVELGFRLEDEGAKFYFAEDGAVVHRGFRPFNSWCNSAYILGVRDVVLLREKGRKELLPRLSAGYSTKPLIARLTISAALRGVKTRELIVRALKFTSGAFIRLGAPGIAHVGYSMIFSIYYWNGTRDESKDHGSFQHSSIGGEANGEAASAK